MLEKITKTPQITGFDMIEGFNGVLAQQVVDSSRQPQILSMAPKDASERFKDVDTAVNWFHDTPDRIFYSLARASQLAGVIWFTPSPAYGSEYTFAIRIYEPFVGQGLGTNFGIIAHTQLEEEGRVRTWADIRTDNIPSQRLAHKLGYRLIEDTVLSHNGRVHMLRK